MQRDGVFDTSDDEEEAGSSSRNALLIDSDNGPVVICISDVELCSSDDLCSSSVEMMMY